MNKAQIDFARYLWHTWNDASSRAVFLDPDGLARADTNPAAFACDQIVSVAGRTFTQLVGRVPFNTSLVDLDVEKPAQWVLDRDPGEVFAAVAAVGVPASPRSPQKDR